MMQTNNVPKTLIGFLFGKLSLNFTLAIRSSLILNLISELFSDVGGVIFSFFEKIKRKYVFPLKRFLCRASESSVALNYISDRFTSLFGLPIKSVGTVYFILGVSASAHGLIMHLTEGTPLFDSKLISSLICVLLSAILIGSSKSLGETVSESRILSFINDKFLGMNLPKTDKNPEQKIVQDIICGLVLTATYLYAGFSAALLIIPAIFFAINIIGSPQTGVFLFIISVSFGVNSFSVSLAAITLLSVVLKVLLGKKRFRFSVLSPLAVFVFILFLISDYYVGFSLSSSYAWMFLMLLIIPTVLTSNKHFFLAVNSLCLTSFVYFIKNTFAYLLGGEPDVTRFIASFIIVSVILVRYEKDSRSVDVSNISLLALIVSSLFVSYFFGWFMLIPIFAALIIGHIISFGRISRAITVSYLAVLLVSVMFGRAAAVPFDFILRKPASAFGFISCIGNNPAYNFDNISYRSASGYSSISFTVGSVGFACLTAYIIFKIIYGCFTLRNEKPTFARRSYFAMCSSLLLVIYGIVIALPADRVTLVILFIILALTSSVADYKGSEKNDERY